MAYEDALSYWADWEEVQRETEQALVPPARLFDSSIRREALDFGRHGLTMLCRDFVLSDPAREFAGRDLDQLAMEVPLPEADAAPAQQPDYTVPAAGDGDAPGDVDAYVRRLAQRRKSREAQLAAGRQRFVGRMQTLLEMQPVASEGAATDGAHE